MSISWQGWGGWGRQVRGGTRARIDPCGAGNRQLKQKRSPFQAAAHTEQQLANVIDEERQAAQQVRVAWLPMRALPASAPRRRVTPALPARPGRWTSLQMADQRRRLPPVLNERSLFTKAAPVGDMADNSFQPPSQRIGTHYSPLSRVAARLLNSASSPQHRGHAPGSLAAASSSRPSSGSRVDSGLAAAAQLKPRLISSAAPAAAAGRAGQQAMISSSRIASGSPRTEPCSTSQQHQQQADAPTVDDALLRYHYYVHRGIDASHLAPYNERWLHRALALVPRQPPKHVSQVRR
jgi:hypothetical protein